MATLGIDPAKEAENTETTNVLGPSGAPSAPESGSQAPGSGMASQPSSMPQSAPKAPSGAKSAGASSGMFQNIKKYAAANRPQASKMAGAVTKNIGGQATNIGKAVEQQQKAFQSSLGQQQGKVKQAQEFTSGIVQNITGGVPQQTPAIAGQPPTEPAQIGPSEQDFTKFREHLTGGAGQFGDVSELNLSKQQQQAKNLAQMTAGAETGEGRRQLLKNTFAQQSPYTAGMQGLDELIVSGDQGARTQLAQGVQDITKQQAQSLQAARTGAMKDLSGYERERGSFAENLQKQLTGGSTQFTEKAEASAVANRVERQALAEQLGITEEQAGQYMQEQFTGRGKNALIDAVTAIGGQTRVNIASQKQIPEMKTSRNYMTGETTSYPTGRMIDNPEYDPNAVARLVGRGGTGRFGSKYSGGAGDDSFFHTKGLYSSQVFGRPTDVYSKQFSDADLELLGMNKEDLGFDIKQQGYAGSRTRDSLTTKARHSSTYDVGKMKRELDRLRGSVEDKTGRDALLASLARGGMESTGELGSKYDELLAGKDISAQSSASEDTISRYNALQDLLQGRVIGDRSLQAGSGAIGSSVKNQEALAKMRADILKRIGQGEA